MVNMSISQARWYPYWCGHGSIASFFSCTEEPIHLESHSLKVSSKLLLESKTVTIGQRQQETKRDLEWRQHSRGTYLIRHGEPSQADPDDVLMRV